MADFDLRKLIIAPLGLSPNYALKPVLRLMDELEIGDIEGQVDLAALAAAQLGAGAEAGDCAGGIYLFGGNGATPDDADGDALPEESECDPQAADGELGFMTMAWTTNGEIVVEPDATTVVDLP